MEFRKTIILLMLAIFLFSITSVCASEIENPIASEDTSQMVLSDSNKNIEDNLQTSEEKLELGVDDESLSEKTDTDILSDSQATYSNLAVEINKPGNVILTYKNYTYDDGATAIEINEENKVIDGNGAVIDMAGSTIQAFTISSSGVTIKNLTIKNVNYNGPGGAIFFSNSGTILNCNFTNNIASGDGSAIRMYSGTVTNCNFTNNKATGVKSDGAIWMHSGNVANCNFINNTASSGGAIRMDSGTVTNCNFTNNKATGVMGLGGAICFYSKGNVINCNFADNSANNSDSQGGAIFSYDWSTADTCIFKTGSDTNFNIDIFPPTLNVDNFTAAYGSGEKLAFDLKTNSSIPVTNGNISISVYFKNNNSLIGNYNCLSGEGWTVDLPVGSYYAIFDTRYDKFNPINRTITITMPKIQYYINVTSLSTNNKTVNITAESNIPKNILWNGKLLFILPNNKNITANYAGNGTWWALHTFDSAGDYSVNASYIGLDNVTINNATISITKSNSIVNLTDVVLNYGDTKNVTATVEGAIGITAMIDNNPVSIINNYTIPISGLAAGTYTLTVTTIADADHNPVTRNVTVTVNKAKTELTADAIITTNSVSKNLVITLKDIAGRPLSGLNITVDINGAENYTTDNNGQVKISTNGLEAKTYEVLITFNGTKNYINCSKTTTVSIYKESSIVDTKPLTTVYNVHKYLVFNLKDNNRNPIRNADAYIEIHGVTYKCRSDNNGDARLIISLNPGKYSAKITFGNVKYTGFTQYVTIIVKKATPKLTAKKKTFKKAKKIKKYIVTLKDNNGKAMAKVKLTLKIKGKTYKAKTNAKGKATFKIKNLKKKGTFKATVTYNGNKYYNKLVKKNVKIIVK